MLDKNELEDLLVKLRLGTISIESAVNEIEQNFYSVDENDNLTVWQKLGCPFDEMAECNGKDAHYVEMLIHQMYKKYNNFILTGIDENIMRELAPKFNKCMFLYDAGIITYIEKEQTVKYDKTVVVVTSLAQDDKMIKELEAVFNILGMPVEICSISKYETVSMQVVKNYLSKAKAVIVAFDKDIRLTSIISNISKKPVVLLSKNKNIEEYMLSNGALLAKPGSALSAAMAVARIIG
ncbi:MAG: hypothetical protein ROM03_09100 [Mucispirillum sp.]|nr:hypothetical protein [Mucispirillum sp.]